MHFCDFLQSNSEVDNWRAGCRNIQLLTKPLTCQNLISCLCIATILFIFNQSYFPVKCATLFSIWYRSSDLAISGLSMYRYSECVFCWNHEFFHVWWAFYGYLTSILCHTWWLAADIDTTFWSCYHIKYTTSQQSIEGEHRHCSWVSFSVLWNREARLSILRCWLAPNSLGYPGN